MTHSVGPSDLFIPADLRRYVLHEVDLGEPAAPTVSQRVGRFFTRLTNPVRTASQTAAGAAADTLVARANEWERMINQLLQRTILQQANPYLIELRDLLVRIIQNRGLPTRSREDDLALRGMLDTLPRKIGQVTQDLRGTISPDGERLLDSLILPDAGEREFALALKLVQFLLTNEQGALPAALDSITQWAVGSRGLIQESLNVFERRAVDQQGGIVARALTQVENRLAGGIIPTLRRESQSALADALALLRTAVTARDTGIIDQAIERLRAGITAEDTGLIALAIAQFDGKFTGDSIGKLNQALFDGADSTLNRARAALTHPTSGLLAEAMGQIERKLGALDAASRGALAQVLEQLRHGVNDRIIDEAIGKLRAGVSDPDTSIVAEAIALVKGELEKPSGLLSTLSRRQQDLINEGFATLDKNLFGGTLVQLREALTDPARGLIALVCGQIKDKLGDLDRASHASLAQALEELNKGLNDRVIEEAIKKLRAGLTAPGTSILSEALDRLRKELEKPDGLVASLKDQQRSVIAAAFSELNEQLFHGSNGTITVLKQTLVHPDTGIVAVAFGQIQQHLYGPQGVVPSLDPAVRSLFNLFHIKLDETIGAAAAKIKLELPAVMGTFNDQQKKIVADGIDALNKALFDGRDGTLVRAKTVLNDVFSDPETGVVAKAIAVLTATLKSPNGPLLLIDRAITDPVDGILARAFTQLDGAQKEIVSGLLASVHEKVSGSGGIIAEALERVERSFGQIASGTSAAIDRITDQVTKEADPRVRNLYRDLRGWIRAVGRKEPMKTLEQQARALGASIDKLPGLTHSKLSELSRLLQTDGWKGAGASLVGLCREVHLLLEEEITSKQGLIARAADAMLKRADEAIDRIEDLLPRMLAALATALEEPGESALLGRLLDVSEQYLNGLIGRFGTAISKSTAGSFATPLKLLLEEALESTEGRPALAEGHAAIQALIAKVEAAQAQGSWTELRSAIKETNLLIKDRFIIYVHGHRVGGRTAKNRLFESPMWLCQKWLSELDPTVPPPPLSPQHLAEKANREMESFVENSARMITLRAFWEKLFGLERQEERFYLNLMHTCPNDQALMRKFFAELKVENIHWLARTLLTPFFYLSLWLSRILVRSHSTQAIDQAQHWIKKNQKRDEFSRIQGVALKRGTDFLAKSIAAYREIGNNEVGGAVSSLFEGAMADKKRNEDKTTEEINAEFDRAILANSLNRLPTYARIVLKPFKLLYRIITTLLGPQALTPRLDLAPKLLDLVRGSAQDNNGYRRALDRITLRLLREVQAELAKGNPIERKQVRRQSDARTKQINALVLHFLQLIPLSRSLSQAQLRELVDNQSWSHKYNRFVQEQMTQDIVERVTHIIGGVLTTTLKDDRLNALIYEFIEMVNSGYAPEPALPDEDPAELEQEIAQLSGQIIDFSVATAIEEQIDFTGEKKEAASVEFLGKAKQSGQETMERLLRFTSELRGMADPEQQRVRTKALCKELQQWLKQFAKESDQFQKEHHKDTDLVNELKAKLASFDSSFSAQVTLLTAMLNEKDPAKVRAHLDQMDENSRYFLTKGLSEIFAPLPIINLAVADTGLLQSSARRAASSQIYTLFEGGRELIGDPVFLTAAVRHLVIRPIALER